MSARWLFAGLLGCARASASEQDCVAGTLVFEDREISADGVTRDSRFEESFVRCGDHVWTARKHHTAVDEHHPDAALLAHHVTAAPNGGAKLELVDLEHRTVIEVTDPTQFHGRWDLAAHLVSREARSKMEQHGAWFERTVGSVHERVLWSDQLAIALFIEVSSPQGYHRITFTPQPSGARPWTAISGWPRRDLSDYGD